MSTLMPSPSPASSPRPFQPRAHSQVFATSSSRRSSYSPKRVPSASSLKQRQQPPAPAAPPPRTYADSSTQYSPDGFPPTAGIAKPEASKETATAGTSKKRKDDERRSTSPSSLQRSQQTQSMSSTSSTTAAATIAPPAEPTARASPPAPPEEARSTAYTSGTRRARLTPGPPTLLPALYAHCPSKDLGVCISSMLMELIRLNDQIPLRDGRLTRFHSRAPPGISVADYLQRLITHATLSPPILLSMVYYIDRLCALYTPFTINSLTVHRFLITAATVAAKGLSDSFWTNPTYARIGGIPVGELATLELEFLMKVQWRIVPKEEVLGEYYRSLVERTEGYEMEGAEVGDEAGDVGMGGEDVVGSESSGSNVSVESGISEGRMDEAPT